MLFLLFFVALTTRLMVGRLLWREQFSNVYFSIDTHSSTCNSVKRLSQVANMYTVISMKSFFDALSTNRGSTFTAREVHAEQLGSVTTQGMSLSSKFHNLPD